MIKMKKYSKQMVKKSEGFNKYLNRSIPHIVISGKENLEVAKDGGATLVSTHRSHFDYIIIGRKFTELGFRNMRFAAGDNLTRIPVLGKAFMQMGAFSVFRGKASQRSYLFKLADQVKKMMLNGDNIVVFPEGGRSYTGRMLEVKGGIIGSTVMAQQEDSKTERYYIPIAVSYDGTPDVVAIPLLTKAKKLRSSKKTMKKFIGSLYYYAADIICYTKIWLFSDKNMKAYVDIGKPIKVNDITDVSANYKENSKNQFFANGKSIKECTEKIQTALLEQFRVLPHNLVSYLFLSDKKIVNGEERVEELLKKLSTLNYNSSSISKLSSGEIWQSGVKRLRETGAVRGSKKRASVRNSFIVSYEAGIIKDIFGEEA
jgi:1-acyl-sn-glycerol-3-phosphate acyltransferase